MEDNILYYKALNDSTPMMSQYVAAKSECQDCLLLFRLGDFYELFFEDAKVASSVLNIVLTHRGKVKGEDIPMCGIPVASVDSYVSRLIKAGHKVAVCEQMEDPKEAKKRGYKAVVKRQITRIISAGTLVEEDLLTYNKNNYLMSLVPICKKKKDKIDQISFALIDISTGEFLVNTVDYSEISSVLENYSPKEILISSDFEDLVKYINKFTEASITKLPPSKFNPKIEKARLEKYFNVSALDSFELGYDAELACCGSVLEYLIITQKDNLSVLPIPKRILMNNYLVIDSDTSKSLEIMSTNGTESKYTLIQSLDKTKTAFGARMLASRVSMPIVDIELLKKRQECVKFFIENKELSDNFREILAQCPDFERSVNRIRFNKFFPRDMENIRDALVVSEQIREIVSDKNIPYEDGYDFKNLHDFSALRDRLISAMVEKFQPNGDLIAEGYSPELDKLRYIKNHSEDLIMQLQDKYIYQTGINTLKIRNNAIIGWYIEIPQSQRNKILPEFMHRQTLVNNIRYTTGEILDLQDKIFKASEDFNQLERSVYNELVEVVLQNYEKISEAIKLLALLDIYTNFALIASERDYICPEIVAEPVLEIENGRHPVLELLTNDFTGNDCDLTTDSRVCLLTGPNMAGKSTYLRQNALLIVMAQIGSYIPAKKAKIGVVDRLFSRIGASDDLARGRSTFMVEMIETATILNQATERSFVILDEVGRGTSTYDGLSIAWAVIESLYKNNKCRVLFATHYRELTALSEKFQNIKCKTLKVQEWEGKVIFYHRIIDGIADKSYGIHVASLAGVPKNVIRRAKDLLIKLESKSGTQNLSIEPSDQIELNYSQVSPVEERLKAVNLNELAPLDALNLLFDLKKMIN
ncbi:MAG: DNA mismatch repair protein MutS [Alphaproteobacteria bacterium]|nr:DNA mismatch repair protein MutS [Alphaproteobacteria bacterium]